MLSQIDMLPVHKDIRLDLTIDKLYSTGLSFNSAGVDPSISEIIQSCTRSLGVSGWSVKARILQVKIRETTSIVTVGNYPLERMKFTFPSDHWPFWLNTGFLFPEEFKQLFLTIAPRSQQSSFPQDLLESGAWLSFFQRHSHLYTLAIVGLAGIANS